jgi:hypothetical protein
MKRLHLLAGGIYIPSDTKNSTLHGVVFQKMNPARSRDSPARELLMQLARTRRPPRHLLSFSASRGQSVGPLPLAKPTGAI